MTRALDCLSAVGHGSSLKIEVEFEYQIYRYDNEIVTEIRQCQQALPRRHDGSWTVNIIFFHLVRSVRINAKG